MKLPEFERVWPKGALEDRGLLREGQELFAVWEYNGPDLPKIYKGLMYRSSFRTKEGYHNLDLFFQKNSNWRDFLFENYWDAYAYLLSLQGGD